MNYYKWIYSNANGCSIGLMKCEHCGKAIKSGDFRYKCSKNGYTLQCKTCGGLDQEWVRYDKECLENFEKASLELSQSDNKTVLRRIKDAFYEGWNSYATPASAYNSVEEAWDESDTKLIYEVLKKKWGILDES